MKKLYLIFLVLLVSCATSSIEFTENRKIINDKYLSLDFTLKNKDTTVNFNNLEVNPFKISIPDKCGNEINYILWQNPLINDNSKLFIFIPGFNSDYHLFYPIAFELIKKGISVCYMDLRENKNSLNQNIKRNVVCNEIGDLSLFIDLYKENFKSNNLSIGIYGVSLGSIIGLNFINKSEDKVNVMITEGMPYDLQNTADKLNNLSKKENIIDKQFIDYSLNKINLKSNNYTKLFSIWGKFDKLINENEISSAVDKLKVNFENFNYEIYDVNHHTFRGIISEKLYYDINKKVIEFIKINL